VGKKEIFDAIALLGNRLHFSYSDILGMEWEDFLELVNRASKIKEV
jgi:hypothetical protein